MLYQEFSTLQIFYQILAPSWQGTLSCFRLDPWLDIATLNNVSSGQQTTTFCPLLYDLADSLFYYKPYWVAQIHYILPQLSCSSWLAQEL